MVRIPVKKGKTSCLCRTVGRTAGSPNLKAPPSFSTCPEYPSHTHTATHRFTRKPEPRKNDGGRKVPQGHRLQPGGAFPPPGPVLRLFYLGRLEKGRVLGRPGIRGRRCGPARAGSGDRAERADQSTIKLAWSQCPRRGQKMASNQSATDRVLGDMTGAGRWRQAAELLRTVAEPAIILLGQGQVPQSSVRGNASHVQRRPAAVSRAVGQGCAGG